MSAHKSALSELPEVIVDHRCRLPDERRCDRMDGFARCARRAVAQRPRVRNGVLMPRVRLCRLHEAEDVRVGMETETLTTGTARGGAK